jgi:Cu(I)/Ag(I) efflux system membrane fusion protein
MKTRWSFPLLVAVIAGAFLTGSWSNRPGAVTATTGSGPKVLYYVDPMHPSYTSDKPGIAPDCGMELVPVYEPKEAGAGDGGAHAGSPGTVHVTSEKQQLIGVKVRPVEKRSITQTLRVLGRVAADETRVYKVNAGIQGFVREVSGMTTGDRVKKGQVLATFSAPDAVPAIQGYVVALNAMDRLKRNGSEGPAQAQITANSSNFQQRLEQLQDFGMSAPQIEEIGRTREFPDRIKVVAPADGLLLARNIWPGQKFDRGAEWYQIADLRRIWIVADVSQGEAKQLRPGSVARVTLPDDPAVAFPARVSHVQAQFDATTRTLKVRLETENPGLLLRPDMFVDVELPVATTPTVAIPVDAVIDSGLKKVVYVDKGGGIFEPRRVETGRRLGEYVEVMRGVSPGERIAVSGTFLLDAESRMRLAAAASGGPAENAVIAPHSHAAHSHAAHTEGRQEMLVAHAGHGHGSAHTAEANGAQRADGPEGTQPHVHPMHDSLGETGVIAGDAAANGSHSHHASVHVHAVDAHEATSSHDASH